MKDFEIKFIIDDEEVGSSVLTVLNGELHTSSAEDEFYSVIRKNSKSLIEKAEELEREKIIDNLTKEKEEILKDEHSKNYIGTDDDMPDAYEDWLMGLSLKELKDYLKDDSLDLEIKSIKEENI